MFEVATWRNSSRVSWHFVNAMPNATKGVEFPPPAALRDEDSNLEPPDPESGVLPVAPSRNEDRVGRPGKTGRHDQVWVTNAHVGATGLASSTMCASAGVRSAL